MPDLEALAELLRDAQAQLTPCAPLTSLDETLTVADAYAIQAMNLARRASPRIGHKVGLTSAAVQRQLGVHEPDFGGLLAEMEVGPGGVLDTASLLQPRAEAELAFVLERDLEGEVITAADVARATAFVLPAIEIIDSRIADWKITYRDTIADNASSARFVLGRTPVMLAGLDLELMGATLRKNGRVVSTGVGAACLGHPLNAVAWLANTLRAVGMPLKAGELILSGALGPVTPVVAGDVLRADLAHVGSVSVRFT